jgi:hypothetical protein
MTDIFQSWKENRFIIAPKVLVDEEKLVILTDIQYWSGHHDELSSWCADRNAEVSGMTVVFGNEQTLTEFVLRWS